MENESEHLDYDKLLCRFNDLNLKYVMYHIIERFNSILNIKSSLEISLIKLEEDTITNQKNLVNSKMLHSKAIEESEIKALEVSHRALNF